MHHGLKERHDCMLLTGSVTALPKLHPNAPIWSRCYREFRKLLMISPMNPRTPLRFRSQESVLTEARRHLKESKVSIHPYSTLAMCVEITMFCTWAIYFFVGTFYLIFQESDNINVSRYILYALKPLLFLHLIISFFMGYYNSRDDYIELRMRKIIKKYALGYLIFDLLFFLSPEIGRMDPVFFVCEGCVHLLMFVRLVSITKYFRVITLMLDFGESFHELLCLILIGFMLMHFFAILVYCIPNFQYTFGVMTNTSWIVLAGIAPYNKVSGFRKYLMCLHKVCAMFLGPCSGMWNARNLEEMGLFTITILTGMFYMAYVIALVLQMSLSLRSADNLYKHMLYQMMYYCHVKKLPDYLTKRMKMYYSSRFKNRYFREDQILSTLSEHLRLELRLHNCRKLLRSTWLFQSLTPMSMGQLLMQLETLVVLPNDVIKDRHSTTNIYFITNGEVAILTQKGTELFHISDGDYFGEFSVLSDLRLFEANVINKNLRYVAVHITEMMVLRKEAFSYFMFKNPSIRERVLNMAKLRNLLNLERLAKLTRTTEFVINEKVLSRSVNRKDMMHTSYGMS